MDASKLRAVLSWIGAAFLLALALPAHAAGTAPTCVAYSSANIPLHDNTIAGLEWDCSGEGWRDTEAVTWLRFDLAKGELPTDFSSRITMFEEIAIATLSPSGLAQPVSYGSDDAQPIAAGAVFTLPLPQLDRRSTAVVVRITRPHAVTIGSEARISRDPEAAHDGHLTTLIVALVAGMLLTPLLFDINCFIFQRERFMLMHAFMVLGMLGYAILSGGLAAAVSDVPIALAAIGGPLCWAIGVAFAAFFMFEFFEPHALPRWARRLTIGLGWWTLIVPGFCALQFSATQHFDNFVYFLSLTPVLVLYSAIIGIALWRGSRAARFLGVAWLPIILASCERLLRGMGLFALDIPYDQFLFSAMGAEVLAIGLAVSDRFVTVRRERDDAITKARHMVELTEHDPLTGLLNRRALEMRFDHLRRDGFQTLALVDLDRFKDINDRFGHIVGDDVLCTAASALTLDRDCLAFRMGGEEFLLLLRGRDAMNRAERLRQGIATRVAADVEGLDRIVTASAGLIDLSSLMAPSMNLDTLYDRADKLLYEAKESGRNRMVSEKLKLFKPRQNERRREAAA